MLCNYFNVYMVILICFVFFVNCYELEGDNNVDLVFFLDGLSDVIEDDFRRSLCFVELLVKLFNVFFGDIYVVFVIYVDDF